MNKDNLLKHKGYYGSFDVCFDSGVLHGKVEFINDLVTFEASSVEELKNEFESAVDDYLETCEELGRAPNKTMTGSFNVRVGQDLHKQLAVAALKHKLSINQVVIDALTSYLGDTRQQFSVQFMRKTDALLGDITSARELIPAVNKPVRVSFEQYLYKQPYEARVKSDDQTVNTH
ncbi:type II toxin-antitoxin system HicB family antitoxin [Marinobacterium stanieri]|uniref:type II toxin-antitoxin system HicB family antitoxin n=1 Tax=Marinobacterium stanieri TaxID=49186 RepID=UPI000255A5E2|nr:type II toxin-antitoxin system HicB family antitoxin [Marinobacterium stanieri]